MSIYLISNRKVSNGEFSNKGRERAKREFRVATCSLNHEQKVAEYQILPDKEIPNYDDVLDVMAGKSEVDAANLPGSAYMFHDLYRQMLSEVEGDPMDSETAGQVVKRNDTLFFIHGFANKLESNLRHIYKLYQYYIRPEDSGIEHLVYVAWPSIGHKVGTYWNDQDDAEETGRMLGGMYNKLYHFFISLFEINDYQRCLNKIHLMTHSMGNTVLEYMLRSIAPTKRFQLFGEVLLLNADCPNDVFEPGEPFTYLKDLSERRHIYISRSDDVLGKISRFTKNFEARLGHKGPENRANLDSETFIVDTTNLGEANSFRERTLDHWGYVERRKVIDDILHVLSGQDEDDIPNRKKWKEERQYFYFE